MPEGGGTLYGVPQPMPVLYVAAEVANPGIEDIAQRVLPEEEVAEYARTLGVSIVDPESAQIGDRVDGFFELKHFCVELFEGDADLSADLGDYILVLFHEADDGLAVVFGYILGLVLNPPVVGGGLVVCVLAVLILRDALLLGNHPGLLVEGVVVDEVGEDGGGGEVDHGALALLPGDLVEHADVVVVVAGEEVVELDLADLLALLALVVIVQQREVEDGRPVVGFYHH